MTNINANKLHLVFLHYAGSANESQVCKPRRGYTYCDSYSQVTPKGAAVVLQAVWKVDNCRSVHEIDSVK